MEELSGFLLLIWTELWLYGILASGGDVICGTLSHQDNNVLFAGLNELDVVVAVDLARVMTLLLIAGGGLSIVTLLWVSLFII